MSQEAMESGRVRLAGGKKSHRDTELIGIPDLMIEVVSDSSVVKDTEWLISKYWNVGISEYWIIDGREGPLRFHIHRRGPRGYRPVRKSEGWVQSAVLGHGSRFVAGEEQVGHRTYTLEVR